jgi:hypothetical protein
LVLGRNTPRAFSFLLFLHCLFCEMSQAQADGVLEFYFISAVLFCM